MVADVQRHVAGEDDLRLIGMLEVDVALGKDGRAIGIVGRYRLPGVVVGIEQRSRGHEVVVDALVVDDLARNAAEVVVAEDVIDVVLGVDDVLDGAVLLDLFAHGDGLRRQLGGVDDDGSLGGEHVARVAAADGDVG